MVEPLRRLVYTWLLEGAAPAAEPEQVTVEFAPRGDGTEVSVTHERMADDAIRASHELGWSGCLDKLAAHV